MSGSINVVSILRKVIGLYATICAVVWIHPAAADPVNYNVQRDIRGLLFHGPITHLSAETAIMNLRYGDTIYIHSRGGNAYASMELAKKINESHVKVIANADCENECAWFIFLPARIKETSLGSTVRFGHSPWALEASISIHPRQFSSRERSRYRELVKSYDKMLLEVGASKNIGSCIDNALSSSYDKAILSKQALADFGVVVGGRFEWNTSVISRQNLSDFLKERIVWVDTVVDCR